MSVCSKSDGSGAEYCQSPGSSGVDVVSEQRFRLVSLSPTAFARWTELCRAAGLSDQPSLVLRYAAVPALVAVVDRSGVPVWAPTLFLARCGIVSRGVTSDTTRTYAESLLSWMRFLDAAGATLDDVGEELLQLYRADLCHARMNATYKSATSTANLRVAVAVQFHSWCQLNGYPSPLGAYLLARTKHERSLAPRVIRRHPRILGERELRALFEIVPLPYRLAFRWGLVTGMRRVEVAGLRCSLLPRSENQPFQEDGLAKLQILRKGGRETPVYVPISLVDETLWYVISDRPTPRSGFEDFVFIGRGGRPLSRGAFSAEFRRCANSIGSDATLHHLRHTYAVHVLRFLDRSTEDCAGDAKNSLKTLQVLMGHARSETTEVYLRALDVTSEKVVKALGYLYGASA